MAVMIETRNLVKRYRAALAVDRLSFTVHPGTVTGSLGPNGSGKSTTMRMIMAQWLGIAATLPGDPAALAAGLTRMAAGAVTRLLLPAAGQVTRMRLPAWSARRPPDGGWPSRVAVAGLLAVCAGSLIPAVAAGAAAYPAAR